jgi:hypothetical protein
MISPTKPILTLSALLTRSATPGATRRDSVIFAWDAKYEISSVGALSLFFCVLFCVVDAASRGIDHHVRAAPFGSEIRVSRRSIGVDECVGETRAFGRG